MIQFLAIGAAILLVCIASNKLSFRLGVPSLLVFLVLGMLAGSDGLLGIYFDNFALAKDVASLALVFIMFYGGFCTNWKTAKPVAVPAVLMSSFGTLLTAGLTGLFCHFALSLEWLESFLIGSVIASTDAASVFSILRSRRLNLKGGLAPLLEIESGSNDPFAYLLTVVVLMLMQGKSAASLPQLLLSQLGVALALGAGISLIGIFVLRHVRFEIEGFLPILVTALAILSYALCELLGGNGFLCVYLSGIILGNSKLRGRRNLVHFFDGISWLMQIMLFFVLGLLSFPSRLLTVILPGALIAAFLLLIARPLATFSILSWFRFPAKQQLFVSWVGIRGAASIVFAIYAVTAGAQTSLDLFHIVFFVVLFSVLLQGTLLPYIAKKLNLVEEDGSVLTTFNDYQDEIYQQFHELALDAAHPWTGKLIMDAKIPDDVLIVMVRRGKEIIIPNGGTRLKAGDVLFLTGDPEK